MLLNLAHRHLQITLEEREKFRRPGVIPYAYALYSGCAMEEKGKFLFDLRIRIQKINERSVHTTRMDANEQLGPTSEDMRGMM